MSNTTNPPEEDKEDKRKSLSEIFHQMNQSDYHATSNTTIPVTPTVTERDPKHRQFITTTHDDTPNSSNSQASEVPFTQEDPPYVPPNPSPMETQSDHELKGNTNNPTNATPLTTLPTTQSATPTPPIVEPTSTTPSLTNSNKQQTEQTLSPSNNNPPPNNNPNQSAKQHTNTTNNLHKSTSKKKKPTSINTTTPSITNPPPTDYDPVYSPPSSDNLPSTNNLKFVPCRDLQSTEAHILLIIEQLKLDKNKSDINNIITTAQNIDSKRNPIIKHIQHMENTLPNGVYKTNIIANYKHMHLHQYNNAIEEHNARCKELYDIKSTPFKLDHIQSPPNSPSNNASIETVTTYINDTNNYITNLESTSNNQMNKINDLIINGVDDSTLGKIMKDYSIWSDNILRISQTSHHNIAKYTTIQTQLNKTAKLKEEITNKFTQLKPHEPSTTTNESPPPQKSTPKPRHTAIPSEISTNTIPPLIMMNNLTTTTPPSQITSPPATQSSTMIPVPTLNQPPNYHHIPST